MGLALATKEYYDNSGGINDKLSPTKVGEDEASLSRNMEYYKDGGFFTRNGSSIMNLTAGIPAQISGAPSGLLMYDFKTEDGNEYQVTAAGTDIYLGLSSPTAQSLSLSGSTPFPDMEKMVTGDDEFLFQSDGTTNRKFDGTTWTNWSIARPTAPSAADNGAGTLGAGDYEYYVSYVRIVSGVIVQESQLSPISTALTLAASRQIQVTIPVSSDSQVNGRVLYRVSPTSASIAYRLTTISNNVDTTYNDDTLADGTIEAEFNNDAAPETLIFEEAFGRMFMRDEDKKTDVYYSKPYKPWNVPTTNLLIFDDEVTCMIRFYGGLIIGTKRSIWFQSLDPDTVAPRRISSRIGILNNRCAAGEDQLHFMATNRKVYEINPTDLAQDEIRLDKDLSLKVDNFLSGLTAAQRDRICIEHYTKSDISKVVISLPVGGNENNHLLILDLAQSSVKKKPVWLIWDNINAACLKQMEVSGEINLYSMDYNGFIWKLDDDSLNGDGSEENGTATSATASTLTDSSQAWTTNEHVGKTVRIISGTGEDQTAVITSNTATQITISGTWTTTPDTTSEFTIGGYDAYHFSNWKYVLGSYDILKQLWYILYNANASGDYNVDLVLQFDFDTSEANQTNLLVNLTSGNAIWGSFLWGGDVWGARSVFQDFIKEFARFRAVRIGFRTRKAGQPFQINGYSYSVQNKGLFFPKAA